MNQSLQGLRVLNTRPLEQGKALSFAINAADGIAIECPALAIEPIEFVLPDLTKAEQAIFVSANAVQYVSHVLKAKKTHWPTSLCVIAVGQGTAAALKKNGINVDFIPEEATSESLLTLGHLKQVRGKTILLFKGEGGRTTIAETLIARGAHLNIVEVYKRIMPKFNLQYLHSLWHEKAVDIILFTSQQAIQNVFAMFGKAAHDWLCNTPCLVISERLAKVAALLGMKRIMVSSPETILQTLHQFNQGLTHGE
ncbi:uroporphyrinogen-III synthase [Legionella cardiaca]|uniref:Uroporphyrinogen-III synthase n=1 Tax=Legionella cardiaca TaxID=1071983 RepID=A0ABY8ASM9_9GAMM|nr:uroporphyrinogen-III synthase [Legionella cardiaca]WED42505.1 uroporphyrinogen-III synthase [Legionella cardiaca]